MKCKFTVAATLLLLLMSTLCCAQENGAALYQKKCASCHGANGEGKGKIPVLKGTAMDIDRLVQHITKGEPDSKGPHKKGIAGVDEEQAKAIAEFVKALQ